MSSNYWQKQIDEPLFPDILWSRPESKAGAGKLAIIGGDSHGFSAPGLAWSTALQSGVGVCKVLLPDAIKKIVKGVLPDADFAPSTPSGSFAKQSINDMLQIAQWSDLCLLSGDIGRNSETAVVMERFVETYSGLLTVAQDAVDYFKETPKQVVDRPETLVVLSLAQLQKLFISTPTITPITYGMTSPQLAEALHEYTKDHPACMMTKHNDLIFIAQNGTVVTHKHQEKMWRVATAARASVFWLQNPNALYESVITSLFSDETIK